MNPKKFSNKSRMGSFKFAFRGLFCLIKNEHNSRIHLTAAIAGIALGFGLKISLNEWALLIIITGLVFISELFNTSLETLADFIHPAENGEIRKVKDYAAAAVLISAIIAIITGGVIFVPKILDLI